MKIRSATLGIPLGWPPAACTIDEAGRGLAAAVASFTAAGWSVQTTRLALPPPPVVLGWREPGRLPELARWLAARCAAVDVGYASLGMVPAAAPPGAAVPPMAFVAQIPAALSEAETIFASAALDTADGVQAQMAIAAAATIVEIAHQTPEGFGNLRFAAAARCPPGHPFSFPRRITTAVRPRWPWPSRRLIWRRRRSPRRRESPPRRRDS